jgi:hypothetical protein
LFGFSGLGFFLHSHHRYTFPLSVYLLSSLLNLLQRVVYTPQFSLFYFSDDDTASQDYQYTIFRMKMHSRFVSDIPIYNHILICEPFPRCLLLQSNQMRVPCDIPAILFSRYHIPGTTDTNLSPSYHDPGIDLANNEYNQVDGASNAPSPSFSYPLVGCIQPSKAYPDSAATTLTRCLHERKLYPSSLINRGKLPGKAVQSTYTSTSTDQKVK